MGNPDIEERSWLKQQYNDIKGNAKWDLIKWVVGPVVVAWLVGLVRWVQHAPWWQVGGLLIVLPAACCVFALWRSRKSETYHSAETPSSEQRANTPLRIYSTLTTDLEAPALARKTFEVLKWFSTFPPNGAAPVSLVAQVHEMDLSAAQACVQELWHLHFIRTVMAAPGDWNGQYAITDEGFNYVRTHAT